MKSKGLRFNSFNFFKFHIFNIKTYLQIILILIPVRYDLAKFLSSSHMPREYWIESLENLKEFLKILKTPDLKLDQVATFQKDGETFYPETLVKDTLCTQLESLDNELFKGFKHADFSSIVSIENFFNHMLFNRNMSKD